MPTFGSIWIGLGAFFYIVQVLEVFFISKTTKLLWH